MKSFGWQDVLWVLAIGVAVAGTWFFFRTPEPARTGLELIARVCEGPAARTEALERHVADPLLLSVEAEAEQSLSHAELEARLAELDLIAPGCSFELDDWSIRPGTRGSTWLEGELRYDSGPSASRARRRLRASFRERGGEHDREYGAAGGEQRLRLERVVLGPLER